MKVKLTVVLVGLALAGAAPSQNWTILFDGKSTDAFRAYQRDSFPDKGWKVEDGALKTILGGEVVDIITKDKYQDFELEFEWKISPGGNSGVMYRVAEGSGAAWSTGPEMQLLDDAKHADGKNPKTSAGSLYALIAPNGEKKLKPVGEWNQAKLVIKNNQVEHWLNGVKVVEYHWNSPKVKALIAKSKFTDMPRFMQENEGHIAFQHHGQEVWLRNIKIRSRVDSR